MDAIGLLRTYLRSNTPESRRAKGWARVLRSVRVRPGVLHRILLAERSLRHHLSDELWRMLYYQPLFELLCAEVGEGCRLEICPDSKLPPVDNVELVLGDRVRLSARSAFQGARNAPRRPRVQIGSDSYVGHRVTFRAGLGITLGEHVTVASNVIFSGDPGHPLDPIARRTEPAPRESLGQIDIGDDVWIAEGSTVLGNVRVGAGSVIGAHSVVTKDIPAGCIAAGNPARVIRELSPLLLRNAERNAETYPRTGGGRLEAGGR